MSKTVSRAALKRRLFFFRVLSVLACVGPLVAVFISRFDLYVTTVPEGIKLASGGTLLLVMIALITLGKMKVPRRVVIYAFVALIAWLIEPILRDLVVLCVIALSGELTDYILIKPRIKRAQEALLIDRAADETSSRVAAQVEEIMKNYTGRV